MKKRSNIIVLLNNYKRMFHYRTDKDMFYIKANKGKGEYGAFIGIYCKKRYVGKVEESPELEAEFPGTEFCYGYTKGKIMIIGSKGIVKTIKR